MKPISKLTIFVLPFLALATSAYAQSPREEQAKTNVHNPAENMAASLRKKYSGRVSQLLICGVNLNSYWMSTDAQARQDENWVDSEHSGSAATPKVGSVQFNVGGHGSEIEFSCDRGDWRGKLKGNNPNNAEWTLLGSGDHRYPGTVTFANTRTGKPTITMVYSCGKEGCRRERIIFDEP
jgi:hypothetical protein